MNEQQLQDPNEQARIRNFLRIGGLSILSLGLVFTAIGLISFFSAFASFGSGNPSDGFPRYFWCVFVGFPLIAVGGWLSSLGFLGAFQRYIAGESAPVAKDVVNYMGENAAPGVKAFAKSVTEGIYEAKAEHDQQVKD